MPPYFSEKPPASFSEDIVSILVRRSKPALPRRPSQVVPVSLFLLPAWTSMSLTQGFYCIVHAYLMSTYYVPDPMWEAGNIIAMQPNPYPYTINKKIHMWGEEGCEGLRREIKQVRNEDDGGGAGGLFCIQWSVEQTPAVMKNWTSCQEMSIPGRRWNRLVLAVINLLKKIRFLKFPYLKELKKVINVLFATLT